jgi:uncharacterized RDD family membrane protein YckC
MAEPKKIVLDLKKPQQSEPKKQTVDPAKGEFAFGKMNYRLLLIGLAFLLLGYILMIGGGSDNPNVFSPALFDFQRITLAPILLLIGFVIELFAIMKRPMESQQ